jgi:uncharacterized protein
VREAVASPSGEGEEVAVAGSRVSLVGDAGVVCERCVLADHAPRRMKGLLGRRGLEPGEGLLLRPAPAIHTWFMRFPIDAVFLDRDLNVVHIAADLGPWRMARARGARAVLELPAGEAARRGLEPGHRLELGAEMPV